MVLRTALFLAVLGLIAPVRSQILVVRDDRWVSAEPQVRPVVNQQVESVERWLRRLRLPYQRVNASALLVSSGAFIVLPANRPDPALLQRLQPARRIVVFAFVQNQVPAWQHALKVPLENSVVRRGPWVLVTTPFSPDLPDGEKAKTFAAWLLEGASLSPALQTQIRSRWREWHQELLRKRRAWLNEVEASPFRDPERREQALSLLRSPIAPLSLPANGNGTAWLQCLRRLSNDHERIHKGMAIALEPREGEVRGVWLHTYAPTDWESVMRTLKEANLNALFFRAGRGGNVVYRSQFLPRDPWAEQADLDELANAVEAARRYGIDLHAWRVNFHFGTAPDWLKEQMAKEDRLVRDPKGQQALWLNPADPRNQEHEQRAMLELLNYPVVGVQFDYIRYPEVPHYDFDYGEVSQRQFEQSTGITLTDFPRSVLFGPLKIRYDDWQRDNITNLVRRIYYDVKDRNPQVIVSAAVWQRHRYYYALIKQDWMRWVREGLLDLVCPMDYTNENDVFRERVREQVLEVNGQVPIAVGIGAYLHVDEWQFVEQVKIARDLGADGFVIFAYNIPFLRECLTALQLGATAQPTYPAYRAPRIDFRLRNGLRLKDSPIVYPAGSTLRFTLAIAPGAFPAEAVQEVRLTLAWERREGRVERVVTEASLDGASVRQTAVIKGETIVPFGVVRLVARGVVMLSDGTTHPFVRRGPFVKGVPSHKFHALVQTLLPYRPPSKARRPIVGVVAEGWGSEQFLALLRQSGRHAFLVRFLEPAYWAAADVLIVPPLRDIRELTYQRALALRSWVEQGGQLVLLSEACGFRAHANLFPEVALVTGEREIKAVRLGATTVSLEGRALTLQPQSGTIIGTANGVPIIVKGQVGKGTVVLCGIRVPTNEDDPAWRGWQKLLPHLIAR